MPTAALLHRRVREGDAEQRYSPLRRQEARPVGPDGRGAGPRRRIGEPGDGPQDELRQARLPELCESCECLLVVGDVGGAGDLR